MIFKSDISKIAEKLRCLVEGFFKEVPDVFPESYLYKQIVVDYKFEKIVQAEHVPYYCVPYQKQLLVTPGNGFAATLESVCYQLLTQPEILFVVPSFRDEKSLEFLRFVSRESDFPVFFLEPDEGLTRFGEHQHKLEAIADFNPDLAILYGSDETIRELKGSLGLHTRIVAYGSKTSIGLHFLNEVDQLFDYTVRYSSDFFSCGGIGCLNTSVLYLVTEHRELLLYREWISELIKERPNHTSHISWNSSTLLSASLIKSGVNFYQEQGVVVRESTEAPKTLGVGNGTAVIVPCSLEEVRREWRGREHILSSVTLEVPGSRHEVGNQLFELGATRITRPGYAQRPSHLWRHDGLPIIPVWGREVGYD